MLIPLSLRLAGHVGEARAHSVRPSSLPLLPFLSVANHPSSVPSVYTKPRGVKVPDYSSPVILKKNKTTVEDFCNQIHKDIAKQIKCVLSSSFPFLRATSGVLMVRCGKRRSATVWGNSVVHSRGQKVGLDHVLAEFVLLSLPSPSLFSIADALP